LENIDAIKDLICTIFNKHLIIIPWRYEKNPDLPQPSSQLTQQENIVIYYDEDNNYFGPLLQQQENTREY
jgi:hypothetical protein